MIIDLERFVRQERPSWKKLEHQLERLEADPLHTLTVEQALELHYLYQRASADLARIATFSAEPETRRYLEGLVARAYGEIHESRDARRARRPWRWFFGTLPRTFRLHFKPFLLAATAMLAGALLGGLALAFDPEAKEVLMPFPHLLLDPSERVAFEEQTAADPSGGQASFSALLMTHNTKVAILALALGMTWGIGTLLLLFYNGVILGAVCVDYVLAGETVFLLGWLLPHGAIELPAILIGGQAGLMLAGALIGRGQAQDLGTRLRRISPAVVTLMFGVALLLVWAGVVEAFLSQYHAPVLPYSIKIAFGTIELFLLIAFLAKAGADLRHPGDPEHADGT